MENNVRENLAKYAHESWTGWMKYMFSKCDLNDNGSMTIPKWAADRWGRQSKTKFSDLPNTEKESDFKEADRMLEIINERKQEK